MAEKQPGKAKRGPGKPIQKGQTLNPKGRPPKGYSLAEFYRAKLESDGAARLEALFQAQYDRATVDGNVEAAKEILTRAYGKPIDTVKLESDGQIERPASLTAAVMAYAIPKSASRTDSPQD